MLRLRPLVPLLLLAVLALPGSAAAAKIKVPRGFAVETFATGLGHPTAITFDPAGGMWTTSGGFTTNDTDGVWYTPKGGGPRRVVKDLLQAVGLVWLRGELYVSHLVPYVDRPRHTGRVTAFGGWDGERFTTRRTVVRGIPTGRHTNDGIVAHEGRLYLGIGSEFDDKPSRRQPSSVIVSFLPSGRGLRVEARGMRNPFGLAFVPGTDILLASENGRDDLGPTRPNDELNQVDVRRGPRHYGFPSCWNQGGRRCAGTAAPLVKLAPHAAGAGVAVARRFGRYGRSAYVAQQGSNFNAAKTGNKIVRVRLTRRGRLFRGRQFGFATRFREHDPVSLAFGPDGALYAGLFFTERVVRIAPVPR